MTSALSSLRNRFLLALGSVLCLAMLALGLIARYQVTPILLADENQYASAELDRAERAMASEANHMRRLVEDWSYWDDTYEFIQNQRPEYVESNLYGSTLETLDLQLMAFLDIENDPHRIVGFNEEDEFTSCTDTGGKCDWAGEMVSQIQDKIAESDEDTHTWLMTFPRMALVGLSPIYRSQEEVPAAGWLAMVRPLSKAWIDGLRETTGIDMTLATRDLDDSPRHDSLDRLSPTQMRAGRFLDAIPPSHMLRLEAVLPRQRYQASLETFRFALYWTGIVLVLTLIVVLLLLERMVLGPLRRFAVFTQRLQQLDTQATPADLLERRDEIGTLAREFQQLREHQQRQQSLLLDLSQHDHLTGLANRRLFDERLAQALDEARWKNISVSALMVDVDYFKAYNDYYGHQAGDECLIALAKCMSGCLSVVDHLVARTGGEEFSVLLPRVTLAEATQHAETLRAAVENLGLPHVMSNVSPVVTVSVGVASFSPERARTTVDPSYLMRRADEALYAAKQAGRNCINHRDVELQQ